MLKVGDFDLNSKRQPKPVSPKRFKTEITFSDKIRSKCSTLHGGVFSYLTPGFTKI